MNDKITVMQWSKVDDCWHFHNGYGHLSGWVEPSKHASFLAFQGMDLVGDFTDDESAKRAVEHARQDVHRMPYPALWT